jgi:secreted Zn-dependent insulinase-like peptidase
MNNIQIEKPLVDHREYHLLCLDNGLEVLLISDEKTDKSAA